MTDSKIQPSVEELKEKVRKLERAQTGLLGMVYEARRRRDRGEMNRLRARSTELIDQIEDGRLALVDAEVNAADAQIQDLHQQFEAVRLRTVETGEVLTRARDAFLIAKRDYDHAVAQEPGLQNALVSAHSARAEAVERRERLLNPEPDSDPPAQAQPHRELTSTTLYPYSSCKRDGSSIVG